MSSIKFILGEETNPKIEGWKEYLEQDYPSIFKDQYDKAFDSIKKYTVANSQSRDIELPISLEYPNNVFAFIGERGSGKTSCMMSVEQMLQKADDQNKTSINEWIRDNRFVSIELIDPSFFDHKCNIMEIIIGKMFKQFKNEIEGKCIQLNDEKICKKDNLIKKFQQVKTDLNAMQKRSDFTDDSLEQLMELASGVELKKSIEELIRSYLSFFSGKDDSLLIIPIDDIDLHTRFAHTMVEQIRKYFILPGVIILMAVKVDQLALVVKNKFSKEFKYLLDKKEIEFAVIDEMVDRYLGKLIPLEHRIYLPDMATSFEKQLLIYKSKYDKSPIDYATVREAVPQLIFEKTRYLFYNQKGATSYIIPRNLRELRLLLKMLHDMQDYHQEEIKPEYNKKLFKSYLFTTWVDNHLNAEGKRIIENLLLVSDATLFNKTVIQHLDSLVKKPDNESKYDHQEFINITDIRNQSYNISLGDAMALINHIQTINPDEYVKRLLFIIKALYSIKLYEYYDEITAPYQINEETAVKDNSRKEVTVSADMSGFSNYEKLVGGNLVNTEMIDIIPTDNKNNSRAQREVDAKKLIDLIDTLKKEFNEYLSLDEDKKKDYEKKLRFTEFIMLLVSRHEDKKSKYRRLVDIYYVKDLSDRRFVSFRFDIMAWTYNVPFIERCYDRFELIEEGKKSFVEICKTVGIDSVYNHLKGYASTHRKHESEVHRLQSCACIRNIEILEDLLSHLKREKPRTIAGRSTSSYKNFFDNFSSSNYAIQTYDFIETKKNESNINEKQHLIIDFSFLNIFSRILSENNDQYFESIVKPITNEEKKVTKTKVNPKTSKTDTNLKDKQQVKNA